MSTQRERERETPPDELRGSSGEKKVELSGDGASGDPGNDRKRGAGEGGDDATSALAGDREDKKTRNALEPTPPGVIILHRGRAIAEYMREFGQMRRVWQQIGLEAIALKAVTEAVDAKGNPVGLFIINAEYADGVVFKMGDDARFLRISLKRVEEQLVCVEDEDLTRLWREIPAKDNSKQIFGHANSSAKHKWRMRDDKKPVGSFTSDWKGMPDFLCLCSVDGTKALVFILNWNVRSPLEESRKMSRAVQFYPMVKQFVDHFDFDSVPAAQVPALAQVPAPAALEGLFDFNAPEQWLVSSQFDMSGINIHIDGIFQL
jgi:hypothetical protein